MTRGWLLAAAFLIAGAGRAAADAPPDSAGLGPLPERPPAPPPAYWVDIERNSGRFSSPKAVESLLDSVANAGFGRVILDLKRRDGSVLFASRRARRAKLGFDLYQVMRKGCEARKLEFLPHLALLAEGDPRTKKGLAYERPEWQGLSRRSESSSELVPQSELPNPGSAILLNVAAPGAQEYELSVLEELLTKLKPPHLLIGEVRFCNADADLGDSTRVQFERWLGESAGEWPGSVTEMEKPRFASWRTFRVGVVKKFLGRVGERCRAVSPETRLSLAVPALYETSVNVGLNWAHPDFRSTLFYATPEFRAEGVAPLFSEFVVVNRDSNPRAVAEVLRGEEYITRNCLPDAVLLTPEPFANKPGRFREALQTILGAGHGVVIADAGSLGALGYWEIVREELNAKVEPGGGSGGR